MFATHLAISRGEGEGEVTGRDTKDTLDIDHCFIL